MVNINQKLILLIFGVYALSKLKDVQAIDERFEKVGTKSQTPNRMWNTPTNGLKYEKLFNAASNQYALPPGLLSRVAYQESRYNPNAVSPAGAVGLMQIVPKWHPTAKPYDPIDSIFYAAKYLRQLYDQTGSWANALAAYNWGIGNLTREGLENAPRETRNYIAEITRDTGVV